MTESNEILKHVQNFVANSWLRSAEGVWPDKARAWFPGIGRGTWYDVVQVLNDYTRGARGEYYRALRAVYLDLGVPIWRWVASDWDAQRNRIVYLLTPEARKLVAASRRRGRPRKIPE